jgi:hypothetical protein
MAPRNPSQKRTSVLKLGEEFVKPYGLDVQPPLESGPFAIHDAGHRFSNVPATVYGELLENVTDHAALDKLYASGAIHGYPAYYGTKFAGPGTPDYSRFVNYGGMPDREDFTQRKLQTIEMGADPKVFEPGQEFSWDNKLAQALQANQDELSRVFGMAERSFKKGDLDFMDGGEFDWDQGFMPTPQTRNTRAISDRDVGTARIRGEKYADELIQGYQRAVDEGRYTPRRGTAGGAIHASDLSDAAMSGKLEIDRGWADEGIFPYEDKISALSNPPARIPDTYEKGMVTRFAEDARAARALNRVKGAVTSGFNATADLAGSVPLFDPEFRQAVERGDVRKAGEQIAKEYLGGTAAAAVMGLGAGAASRLAPQTTAAVLPAVVGATRIANPVAVVSQLGGSTKPSQRQQSIERQQDPAAFGAQGPSANPQLLKAEAARRRGGRWKIGPFTVPELGLSEAGGFLFR